jgi:NAD+ synthase
LYKTQVRRLAAHLGISPVVIGKPSSPQLWPGHRATDEIPTDYDKLDLILYHLFDAKLPVTKAAIKAGVGRSVVEKVLEMNRNSSHKRALPPSLVRR